MSKRFLVTGGAGFIGSHLCDSLLADGHTVRALDNLNPQVHGEERSRPEYLNPEVELVIADIRNPVEIQRALRGIDVVYHLAASVGVGQSMYQIADYTDVNNRGTSILLEALIRNPVERLIVASSMSLYGEGLYRTASGEIAAEADRTQDQLRNRDWEIHSTDGQVLEPVPTPEWKIPRLASIYALSKFDQEKMCLLIGAAYGIDAVALRFFNVYGPRQALSNPYTGVLAIFASRLLNQKQPLINEDGLQQRDFVNVHDVVRACILAQEEPNAVGNVFNIGSGNHYTIRQIADLVAQTLNATEIQPHITGNYRFGDIRHCFADITLAEKLLGYHPQVTLKQGLEELSNWLQGRVAIDRFVEANTELTSRGLSI
ncbi:MAG: nucleoside-diphosphate-sugar epimerase [Acidobacteria bacterium]|nr:MAG: nucleoside-diphosphate-sugar epimerase [Acidobacteriota bacterium]